MTKFLLLFLGFSLILAPLYMTEAIEVYPEHRVYEFLDRMETRGAIENPGNNTKPLSRLRVAELLSKVKEARLTAVEKSLLEEFKALFKDELEIIGQSKAKGSESQFLPLKWETDNGKSILARPLLGFSLSSDAPPGGSAAGLTAGAEVWGRLGLPVSFYFSHTETQESSASTALSRKNTPQKGIASTGHFQGRVVYRRDRAGISLQTPWFALSTRMGSEVWGPGYRGNLVLSDNSPNYAEVRLQTHLGDWLRFTYIHAFLNSGIIDSLRSYRTDEGFSRKVLKRKYLVAQSLEISPHPRVNIGLSEGIIYGDRQLEALYLVPVIFLWGARGYLEPPLNDNANIAADLEVIPVDNLKFYGSLYIDELHPETMFNPQKHRNQVGMQFGSHLTDLFLKNTGLRFEYTRIYPWVYSHKFPVNVYENYGYILGHWIGQNADDLFLQVDWRPKASILLRGFFERFRKGGKKDVEHQYDTDAEHFLYGKVKVEHSFGFGLTYWLRRDIFLTAGYKSPHRRLYFEFGVSNYL